MGTLSRVQIPRVGERRSGERRDEKCGCWCWTEGSRHLRMLEHSCGTRNAPYGKSEIGHSHRCP